MGYEVALTKAWAGLEGLSKERFHAVRFLTDEYSVDLEDGRVLSLSCNIPAKDFTSILLLHYLRQRLKGLPGIRGEWISFRQIPGGDTYYPSFQKRALDPITRKHGSHPASLLASLERLKARRVEQEGISAVLDVFEAVPVFIRLFEADQEFGAEANMLFDLSIKDVFCTEDVVVLAGVVASAL